MKKGLKSISANHTLDFYRDSKNINNQKLVYETISHFENIRNNIFKPLEFLNLLTKQFNLVIDKSETPLKRFETLKAIPLTPEQKHILYFFIIKWHGGVGSLFPDEAFIFRLIENEFKKYKKNTPEKELYFLTLPKIYQLTFKQIELLKLNFDKLTYPEKLIFWDENIKNDFDISIISSIGYYAENEIKELGIASENSISIFPKDKAELQQHNRWIFNHIVTDKALNHCNFDSLKEKYFEKINGNPRAIEYIEKEISSIIKQREKEKIYYDEKRSISLWGYYIGYQSVVDKEDYYLELPADKFKRIAISYVKGIADSYYLGFLEEQIEMFKKRENVLPTTNESLPDKNNTTSINGKKFYNTDDFKQMIVELLKLDPLLSFNVTDFLEFHYSQAAFTTRWSRVNWFTMFRKTLFMYGYQDDKHHIKGLPNQIRNAFNWERQKSYDLVNVTPPAMMHKAETQMSDTLQNDTKQTKQGISVTSIKVKNKKYSHKQIAIAYWAMGILLTKNNAPKILQKYSNNSSIEKLLRQQVSKPNELTALTKVKTSDTKHLMCLIAAKELISGTRGVQNQDDAINKIDRIITAFRTTYETEY